MTDLLFARTQMGMSLAFHIIFAVLGIGMPVLMVVSEILYRRRGHAAYLELARRWAAGTAIIFAVGAVSGTVLSFELGLLWPRFMEFAGGVIGLPFALEGFAFFTEAIFLGIYLYGWQRVSPGMHIASGIIVAVSGALSAVFVVTANAWMNTPAGFQLVDGRPTAVDPLAAMANPAALQQVVHMVLACYVATGFAVAGVHAFYLLRDRAHPFHRRGLAVALAMAMVATPLQIVSGDLIARMVAEQQPVKFAALEAVYETRAGAPLTIGGFADDESRSVSWGIEVPLLLSLLAHGDVDAPVAGLEEVPEDLWPPVQIVHWCFDLMVLAGFAMLAVVAWASWSWWRRRSVPDGTWLLRSLVASSPLGFLAIEAGWMVTEIGRQPWVIYGVMKTEDAVTPIPGLGIRMLLFLSVYCFLSLILVLLLRRQFRAATEWSERPADG